MSNAAPRATWQQVMIRVKDQDAALKFYTETLGLTLFDFYVFEQWNFSLHFVGSLPPGQKYDLTPGTPEAHQFLWSYDGVLLEITYNHGTEQKVGFKYHPGNTELDGFKRIGVAVEDVAKAMQHLEESNINLGQEPFTVVDPDGYTIYVSERASFETNEEKNQFMLSATSLNVRNGEKSAQFYTQNFGMTLLGSEASIDGKSTHFRLCTLPSSTPSTTSLRELYRSNIPVLELVETKGRGDEEGFAYRSGNVEPFRGYGHIGFLVDDVYAFSEGLEEKAVKFQKKPDEGGMKGLAFTLDPDGFWIEIIKRGQAGKF